MELFVDPNDIRPLTTQLYEQLREAIVEGQLGPGDRLAPTRTVAADLGVSRSTLTEVYGRLVAEGYIEGRSGHGSTVAALTPPPAASPPGTDRLAPPRGPPPSSGTATRQPSDIRPAPRLGRPVVVPGPGLAAAPCCKALDRAAQRYDDPAGTAELRGALARWVTRSRGVTATADEVVVTSGAGHAIDLVARVLLDPGDVVAVEDPGYPR